MEKTFEQKLAEATAQVPSISADEANAILVKGEAVFIDPRDAEDIPGTGIIPNALNIRLQHLEEESAEQLEAQLGHPERKVIAACGMGPMGALAAHCLQRKGYRNVAFVDGGTQGWVNAGYPTH